MTGTRIWALGTTVVIVVVLALGYLLGVSPMLTRLAAAEEELASAEATNQAQQATLQVMKAQYEDLPALQEELQALRVSIPGVVDSDFIYKLLADYQFGSATAVSSIITGEAQPYGVTPEGEPTTDGVNAVPNLYTVPVTITFTDTPGELALAFVAGLQRGPRLFLVTSFSGGEGENGGETITVTAYMFVLSDPGADPEEAHAALTEKPWDVNRLLVPLGPVVTPADDDSSEGESPEPDPGATPTPTPTGTPAP